MSELDYSMEKAEPQKFPNMDYYDDISEIEPTVMTAVEIP